VWFYGEFQQFEQFEEHDAGHFQPGRRELDGFVRELRRTSEQGHINQANDPNS
jgi:hypothetical protein